MKSKIFDKIFPDRLWNPTFTFWWVISLASVLMFDIFWMLQTTFRPFSFLPFWPILFLSATILAFPSVFSKNGLYNAVLLLIVDGFFIANLMYCRTYFNAIPFHSYALAGNLADFKSSVADSFKWYFIFLPVLTVAAYFVYSFVLKFKKKRGLIFPYIVLMAVLSVLTWASDAWRGGHKAKMDFMRGNAYEAPCIAPVYSIPGFLAYDYMKSMSKITPEEKKQVEDWLEYHEGLAGSTSVDSLILENTKKNLVIILCESLESWPIGTEVEGKELTPYINSLIADTTTFYASKVVSQAGPGRSIDGQLLVLAGMLPLHSNVYAYENIDNKFFTLPKAIKEKGGNTYLLTCDKPYVWNQTRVAKEFGIDTLIHANNFINNEAVGAARRLSDGGLMRQSVEKLKSGEIWNEGEKAFVMWVTYSGHNPFRLPEHLRQIELNGNYPEIVKNYMYTVNYTDSSLAILIEYLKSRKDWEDTMVVITGDHEGLSSDRKTAIENPESAKFVDPGQYVPLIVLNSPVAGRYDGEMGQVDIFPTIIDLMGFDDYEWKGMGLSVIRPDFPGVAIGSSGDVNGDPESISREMFENLKQARNISDLILRFNLLDNPEIK